MLHDAPMAAQNTPHVIVVGNEKGGSGKTTIAMHVAVALLKEGQRVGTIDLDSNQKSLTHYIKNRRVWTKHQALNSRHRSIATSGAPRAPSGQERGRRIGGI